MLRIFAKNVERAHLALADVVYVMHEGMITGKVEGKDATQEKLMKLALGID